MTLWGISSGDESIPVLAFDEIDSTNAEARRRAEAGETGPLWITAAVQTAGRGRRGRSWDTSRGNLAATLLIVTTAEPAEAAQLSFVAAFAIRALAEAFVPAALVRLKWPNDVMVDGRKLSGILIESGRTPSGDLWLAIGMGVNLAHAPKDVERPATALADHLKAGVAAPPTPAEALAILSAAFARHAAAWSRAGFAPLREEWLKGAAGIGSPCVARLDRETVEGVAEGLDGDGALLLRLPDRSLRRISAGDVFFPNVGAA
jgi:BirA family biotin operon repressor/biotin-[acetyl-CoA-carboxylase] ligase